MLQNCFVVLLSFSLLSPIFANENDSPSGQFSANEQKTNYTGMPTQKETLGRAYSGHYSNGKDGYYPVQYGNEGSYGGVYAPPPPPLPPSSYGAYGGLGNTGYGYVPPPSTYDTYGGGYNVHDNYGPQSNYPPQQQYGSGPLYQKNYHQDTYYCSVHGSFAMAYTQKSSFGRYGKGLEDNSYKGFKGYSTNESGYGQQNGGYGNGNSVGYYKSRVYTRQYCRYAASASEAACQFCCRVVARSSNTSPDDIVSAIFAFDPLNPSGHGAGYGDYGSSVFENKEEHAANKKIFQCVCCAPKDTSY